MTGYDDYLQSVRRGAKAGLVKAGHRVVAVATPLTPLEYGDLRSSLAVSTSGTDTSGYGVDLGYGEASTTGDLEVSVGSDLPYAVVQHEDLTLRHDDGGPKFLERAVQQSAGEVAAIVAAEVRRAAGA
jgi:hypothetical protein